MPSATTKGIPYPLPTDLASGGADAIKALATDLDFTKVMQLSGDVITSASPLSAYPLGVSSMNLSTAQAGAGGWPGGNPGQVWTFAVSSSRAAQYFYRASSVGNFVFFRTIWDLGANPWQSVSIGGQASGTVSLALPTAQVAATVAITFPTNMFSTPPSVVVGRTTATAFASLPQLYWVQSVTATGCLIGGIAAVTSGGVPLNWIASA